jgi:hypothetical protein
VLLLIGAFFYFIDAAAHRVHRRGPLGAIIAASAEQQEKTHGGDPSSLPRRIHRTAPAQASIPKELAMAEAAARKKVTIPMLMEKKKRGEPIVQLAVYDYETAIIADRVGIDILCVSDTGGMVLFGHESTTSVSFEEGDVHGAGGQARLAIRAADGRHAVHELPLVGAAGCRQRGQVRLAGRRRSDEVRRQPAPREVHRSDREGGHSGAGTHRHLPDAHSRSSAASRPRARPRIAPRS